MQPRPRLLVERLTADVDEPDVHDALSGAQVGQVVEAVDEPGRRQPVHHLELRDSFDVMQERHGPHRHVDLVEPLAERRGRAVLEEQRSILANVRRRLYQRRRLPSRPTSGTTQNGSPGSKSYGWQ